MNIGICCYPTYGGSGVVATELGKQLALRGHNVHFISYDLPFRLEGFNDKIWFHQVEDVNYPVFKDKPYMISLAAKIAEVAVKEKLDVIHSHYAIPHTLSAYLAKQMIGDDRIKLVTTLHGTDITVVGINPTMKIAVKFAIEQSDSVTAVSHFLKEYTQKKIGVNTDIQVVHNFIDQDAYFRKPNTGIRKNFARDDEKVITHISNFRPVKRLDDVLDIYSGIQKSIKAKLLLVGDGPEYWKLHKRCKENKELQNVCFLGTQNSIVDILSVSDLFLLPSENESFGLVALEAMACGVPVIATAVGGIPEVVINGMTGFLSDIGDVEKMAYDSVRLLTDTDLNDSMKAYMYKHIEQNFSAKKILSLYEQIYM